MKPGFALSLSVEGITLLHRAAGGWRLVGSASPESADLAEDLADLREAALRLAPEGVTTKLILPNDQIRYLSVETGGFAGDARTEIVRNALGDATPYNIEELRFDMSPDGKLTHVAAVAHETLEEAESFARDHGFVPVSFVAVPGEEAFLGEPWFGETDLAAQVLGNKSVEPDGIAVVVIGDAVFPDAEPEPATDPEIRGDALPGTSAAPDNDDQAIDPPAPPAAAMVGFASRRTHKAKGTDQPGEAPEIRADTDPQPPDAAGRRKSESSVAAPDLQTPHTDATENAGDQRPEPDPLPDPVPAPFSALPDAPDPEPEPEPKVAVTAPVLDIPEAATPPGGDTGFSAFLSRRRSLGRGAPGPDMPPSSPMEPPRPAPIVEPLPERQRPRDEADRMTVFGARQIEAEPPRPPQFGLILTAGLLAFLAAIAIWASLFLEDGVAGLFRFGEPARIETAAAPEPAALPAPASVSQTEPVRNAEIAAQPAPQNEPITDPVETELSLAPVPTVQSTGPSTFDAPADQTAMRPDLADTAPSAQELQVEDAAIVAPPPELTDTDIAVLDALRGPETAPRLDGNRTTDPAFYAATGIWSTAPDAPDTPSIISLDDLFVAAIDRTDLSHDALALQRAEDLDTDAAPSAQSSPPSADSRFALDDRGLVEPSAEGTLNPDGILIFAGLPEIRPTSFPERRAAPQDATDPEQEAARARLAGLRPKLRPENLAEQTERTQLGGLTRSELAEARPRARPESLQERALAESSTKPDLDGTAQAVLASIRPDARPAGFANTVARATPTARTPQDTAAAASATIAPSIPSSASVARQATLDNAINLRKVNLIGVYGTPSDRRALVRLPSGRYVKVKVGDRVDGGRVLAIGDSELRYQKSGRNLTLKMPSG